MKLSKIVFNGNNLDRIDLKRFNIKVDTEFYKKYNILVFANRLILNEEQLQNRDIRNVFFLFKLKNIKVKYVALNGCRDKKYQVLFNEKGIGSAYFYNVISLEEYIFVIKEMIRLNVELDLFYNNSLYFEKKQQAIDFINSFNNKEITKYCVVEKIKMKDVAEECWCALDKVRMYR